MSRIGLSYTSQGGTVYNFIIDNFGDRAIPRTYQSSASFSDSANGASIISGPAYKQKFQWVISTLITKTQAESFDQLFNAWDEDRANGFSAACGIIDETFGPDVNTSAVFVTPPSYVCLSPRDYLVSFGLAEA